MTMTMTTAITMKEAGEGPFKYHPWTSAIEMKFVSFAPSTMQLRPQRWTLLHPYWTGDGHRLTGELSRRIHI